MTLTGRMLIGGTAVAGSAKGSQGMDAASGAALEPHYGGATEADIHRACALADAAFGAYRATTPEVRAQFLELVAAKIEALGDALTERACAETGLPRGRIELERGRTVGQLRLFAGEVREGSWQDVRIDSAQPDRKPAPRPDLRMRMVPLGPVAVFAASNFPLAFSVAGGDTASALAAGCPVVVKAHRAHPGTSELVGQAVQAAVREADMPEGVFSLLFGEGASVGSALVADPRIKAVGFTGSRAGGRTLVKIAAARPEPIPVYAEMSSINPVLLLPGALAARGAELGKAFVGSLTLGAGQFCTNPGLVLAIPSPGLDAFVAAAAQALDNTAATVMLTRGIFDAYEQGVNKLETTEGVELLGVGRTAAGAARAAFFGAAAETFEKTPHLADEVFGAAGLLVRNADAVVLARLLQALEGQLTITVHMTADDESLFAELLPLIETKAGRIVINGWPTGVEVCHAMVHGGPSPATSDTRTTSVGSLAIRRFLRPVCYQNFAVPLLPEALRDGNPLHLWRRLDGRMTAPEG